MASGPSIRRILSKGRDAVRNLTPGQPTHATHPEFLSAGELTPGIRIEEYAARRQTLIDSLPSNSISIIPAAAGTYMTGHIPYPYRQEADFYFLTGLTQPRSVAVLGGHTSQAPGFTLFVTETDEHDARWTGMRLNTEAAMATFGADEAYPMSQMACRLSDYIAGTHRIWYDKEKSAGFLHVAVPALRAALEQQRVSPLKTALHAMRWRKSAAEVALMRQSALTAAAAIGRCMHLTQPGSSEHCLAATFEYECKMRGAQGMAYPPVVAGGSSATIIHYGDNNKVLHQGQLLLMDAGCERHGYVSDVTRTWPVSGKFSPEQRAVYDIVLDMHKSCLQKCTLGSTLRDVHQHSIRLASQGIADLGLLPGQRASYIARDAYREFYPHSLGHWLGLDTHDVACQSQDKLLQPGVVMTVEPGLYIPNHPRYGRYAGIGVRIEDDVAISEKGPVVLSDSLPVEAADVEDLVGIASDRERQVICTP